MGIARKKILRDGKIVERELPIAKYVEGLSGEEKRILRQRAERLAVAASAGVIIEEGIEATVFMLSGEKYAIESRYIKETLKLDKFTRLPTGPKFLIGLLNLRGEIISIINLKEFFGLKEEKITDLNRVVVLEQEELKFGVLVDKIEGNFIINESSLTTDISTIKGVREEYLKGISSEGVILLDGKKILGDKKIIIDEV